MATLIPLDYNPDARLRHEVSARIDQLGSAVMVSALSGDIPEEGESFPYQVLLLGDAMLEHETMDGCAPSVAFN